MGQTLKLQIFPSPIFFFKFLSGKRSNVQYQKFTCGRKSYPKLWSEIRNIVQKIYLNNLTLAKLFFWLSLHKPKTRKLYVKVCFTFGCTAHLQVQSTLVVTFTEIGEVSLKKFSICPSHHISCGKLMCLSCMDQHFCCLQNLPTSNLTVRG